VIPTGPGSHSTLFRAMDTPTDNSTVQTSQPVLTDWLALYHTSGIGNRRFHALLDAFGTPTMARQADTRQLQAAGLQKAQIDALRSNHQPAIEADLRWAEQPGHHLLCLADKHYPVMLRQIADPPPLLYARGNIDCLQQLQIAIVGSRNPTQPGLEITRLFATHLSRYGLLVCSGMALGIDAAAHQSALSAGQATVAVMGTGLNRVYPARHRELAHQIAEQGVLVSEFSPDVGPQQSHFPRRNRIISGLSLGVVVMEAALRSGSLTTARHAMEQGREVFAIPGSINNPLARGCHRLIREGAKLVETAEDILEELGELARSQLLLENEHENDDNSFELQLDTGRSDDRDYDRLLSAMAYDPASVDALVMRCGLTAEEVSSMLLILELQGHVITAPGGCYVRVKHERNNT